ncbi:MAG: hypothetical protein JRI89_13385, partial [Deltaproteobacteria bacterium]|nr:hypothetical protein [Deltaproteobacteria bacterium]
MQRFLAVFTLCTSLILLVLGSSPIRAETIVSGTVITSDGMVVASGVVALEQGELHNNN